MLPKYASGRYVCPAIIDELSDKFTRRRVQVAFDYDWCAWWLGVRNER